MKNKNLRDLKNKKDASHYGCKMIPLGQGKSTKTQGSKKMLVYVNFVKRINKKITLHQKTHVSRYSLFTSDLSIIMQFGSQKNYLFFLPIKKTHVKMQSKIVRLRGQGGTKNIPIKKQIVSKIFFNVTKIFIKNIIFLLKYFVL